MNFEDILDSAVKASVYASSKTERTQINQLLEKLESETGFKGVVVTIIHILRQVQRGMMGEDAAKEIISSLKYFLDIDKEEGTETAKNNAREYLGLIKWLYDGNDFIKLSSDQIKENNNFSTLLEKFLSK